MPPSRTASGMQVDAGKNFILLRITDAQGRMQERRIVWDKDFAEQARLENARIGDQLSVRADRNPITRNWKVKSLG